ncbi:hypothetical protein G5714_017348 [Onychostoma macrolepis]|uniref:Uncharacterized protein n=1 Tax=Onychostoma macrolepis TaxID=369639 RepID=A0A7J6C5J8_9TELE|nr:hypothetical protein G5714_017348 [Onychostoma macrolepis]
MTSVVPVSWIFDDNGTLKCRWTSSLSNIKNNSPPNPNWKVYDIVKIVGPSIGDYDQANQYISDYTTGVSAAEDSITYSMRDPAVVELPEKRKRKKKLCDESDINSETSSCEDDMNLKQSGNEVKQSGLKTRNVPLPKPPIYHDALQRSAKKDEDDPKSSAFSDLNTKILQQIQMLEQRQAVIMNDLAKVKSVLMKRADEDAHEELLNNNSAPALKRLKPSVRGLKKTKIIVHYLIHTHGSSNIGEMVRQSLKSIATDDVLCLYNRTGKDGKKVLPPVLLTCLKRCVRSFQTHNEIEVKKQKVVTITTPEAECIRQVEIFVSNANTRLKRKENKEKN